MTMPFVISHLGFFVKTQPVSRGIIVSTLAILLTCNWMYAPAPAFAQDALLGNQIKSNDKKPMLIQADELVFDNKINAVKAEGNVEIYYNDYTLVADKITYFKGQNKLIAEGNVRIKEPDGAVVNADKIELTDDFKQGFIRSLKVVAKDDTRIGAKSAERIDGGNTTIFTDGMFTPCKACKDHPEKAPIWQVKSHKIIHNKVAKTIEYEDATFEFMGVPVAYLPYFSHADPTVKRKSGFLAPQLGYSKELGFIGGVPYHMALAENYDATITPVFMSEKGLLGKGTWRHRLANGQYKINVSGLYQNEKIDDGNPLTTSGGERDWRGSIDSTGDFSLGSYWNLGWDVTVESDDTYRRYYKIDDIRSTDRVSKGYLIGQGEKSYFSAQMYHFGGLVIDDESDNTNSTAAPLIDYNYVASDPVLGGELSFNSNITSLQRDQGTESNRAIAELKWRKTFTDPIGQLFTPFAQARGDLYKVKDVLNDDGSITDEESFSRGAFTGGIEYRYPFVSHTNTASHIIEPIGQVVTHADTGHEKSTPNEDAQSLVFDDTLLFNTDKFSGYDRFETGTRANVGLQYTMQFHEGGYIKAVVGQSFHLGGDNAYKSFKTTVNNYDTGLETNRSDYVAALYVEPNSNLSFASQARFDEKTYEVRRLDSYLAMNYGPFTLSGNHTYQSANDGVDDTKHEVSGQASIQLVKNWYLLGGARYNLEENFMLSDNIGLKYADECFLFAVNFTETFTADDDIEPDQSVMFRFELKHLGGFGTNYDVNSSSN